MIDTHSHLYAVEFEEDRFKVIERSKAVGIERIFLPAIDSETHELMMNFSRDSSGYCLPMMGLHPCSVDGNYEYELKQVEEWLAKEKFYAVVYRDWIFIILWNGRISKLMHLSDKLHWQRDMSCQLLFTHEVQWMSVSIYWSEKMT